ncbi:MAG: oxygen-independent coproporphyrinogen III oxidase [Gammaproteobacteria bacterium]|nr:oxygen-independent coproporphyrinogen III oxidase [Gammaproteobacteria bacterium]MDH3448591.1 oxygen-independent coproporphyrinogen III oxidase [Gammaproteobacteria bacterium]
MKANLIQKYNIPGPRYTSYPTVPYWDQDSIDVEKWKQSVDRAFLESNASEGISLYVHLPYCESLCTFCGCHKRITKRHEVEAPYIDALLNEWGSYRELFSATPRIRELHLGGGTPTFFSPDNLLRLIDGIMQHARLADDFELGFEGHPNSTTREHLATLYDLGFRRCSFGVQDYDPVVQKAIHRMQSFERVREVTETARETGYTSISHDLVFGLPHQTLDNVIDTIEKTNSLLPDRLAFYSYAHVPWIKGTGQRGFSEADLPRDEAKRALYEAGKKRFAELGYTEIGMDHFALESDSLYRSMQDGSLHRNFMGYTANKTRLMIGLGMSAIGDSWYAFAQNEKTVPEYEARANAGELPVFRGHLLTDEDRLIRQHILDIMCRFETSWEEPDRRFPELEECLRKLGEMEADGLLKLEQDKLLVPEPSRPFVRNVCMAFDLRLMRNAPDTRIFSMTI